MFTTIIGIDCATQAKKTGLAIGSLENEELCLKYVTTGSNFSALIETLAEWAQKETSTLLALDAPLGWPVGLGTALHTHVAGDILQVEPNQLFRRETDRFIKAKIGKQPLDVGADRIARTAHAALTLLNHVRKRTANPIPLTWQPGPLFQPSAIEVYPAATLLTHAIHNPGYKQKENIQARNAIITCLRDFMKISIDTSLIEQNDDALDAVLCVLAGADFLKGHVYLPTNLETARKEGWIWVYKPDH